MVQPLCRLGVFARGSMPAESLEAPSQRQILGLLLWMRLAKSVVHMVPGLIIRSEEIGRTVRLTRASTEAPVGCGWDVSLGSLILGRPLQVLLRSGGSVGRRVPISTSGSYTQRAVKGVLCCFLIVLSLLSVFD